MKKWALVTGASSGIGFEFARQLSLMGYDMIVVSNDADALRTSAAILRQSTDVAVREIVMDLACVEAAQQLYDLCQDADVKIVINNAGVFRFKDVADMTPTQVETVLSLHVTTVTMICRLFAQHMIRSGGGHILNMSSLSAWIPMPGITLYSATKLYIRGFSKALAYELRESGVSVTAVCPGGVATNLYNLNEKYKNIGVSLGVLMTPERMVRKSLRAMFRGCSVYVPGKMNHLFVGLLRIMPTWAIIFVRQKLKKYGF